MTDAEHSTGGLAHPGLGWSRFGFGLGVVASTAANIAHSFTPSAEQVQRTNELAAATGRTVDWSSWTPPLGTIIAAAFWPIALVVSVEVISRVMWPEGWRWKLMRFGGISVVAGVAAIISYKHLHGLIGSYGEDGLSSAIGPLAIDGLMVVCSAALLAIGQNKRSMAESVHAAPVDESTSAAAEKPAHSSPVQSAPKPVQTAAVRKTVQRTRTTRTAPVGAESVPPRVLDMARALDDKYPGPIPGRRTVMPAMGWSSVGDAQAAINHLKAERAKAAQPVHLVPDSPAELDRVAV